MSIEYDDKSKIEQQKIESQEKEKTLTGREALNSLKQEKGEGSESTENREMPKLEQERFSGKQALDFVQQEKQATQQEKREGLSPGLGGMDGGGAGGNGGNGGKFEDLSGPKEGDAIRREYLEGDENLRRK